jgi:hypothetical protein
VRLRPFVDGAGIVALALSLGVILSLATTRVVNWFVMTDELHYERLAISVAHTGSLLPRIHGELVSNVNQLYPIILSLVYGDGNVPSSLEAAHRLNAFLFASAAIPVYLLARRVGIGRIASVWVGALAVAVPWSVLASFLMTEVVAYPAFCWALLALTHATIQKSSVADGLAFAALLLAVVARTQLLVLALAFPVAVVAEALLTRESMRSLVRSRPVLLGGYGLAVLVFIGAAVSGEADRLLGSYSVTATGIRLNVDLLQLAAEHVAVLALGVAILPFVAAAGWLVDRVHPSAPAPERAFAVAGCATVVLLTLQVASFNQRFGAGLVKDRYYFYAVPVVLVALAAMVTSARAPRWWTFLVPASICSVGFAAVSLARYEKLNVDSPLAILNDEVVRLATSVGWAQVTLVAATIVAVLFLVVAGTFLPRPAVGATVAVLATFALPLQAVYAFDRLFAVNGTNGLPITLDQGGVFNWIDRNVGKEGRVTMIRYPVNSPDFWANAAYWWDVEFWNESVVEDYSATGPGEHPWLGLFDRKTGAAQRSDETSGVLFHGTDVRFRLAGKQIVYDRGAYVFEAERPWRAAFVTDGIYGDGWTRPHTPAEITVFAEPGQRRPLKRFVTIRVASPDHVANRPVTISSNLQRWKAAVRPEVSLDHLATVCVPPGGSAKIAVETPIVSAVYRDPTKGALTGETDRPAGLLLQLVWLADEREQMERCPRGATGQGVR